MFTLKVHLIMNSESISWQCRRGIAYFCDVAPALGM